MSPWYSCKPVFLVVVPTLVLARDALAGGEVHRPSALVVALVAAFVAGAKALARRAASRAERAEALNLDLGKRHGFAPPLSADS